MGRLDTKRYIRKKPWRCASFAVQISAVVAVLTICWMSGSSLSIRPWSMTQFKTRKASCKSQNPTSKNNTKKPVLSILEQKTPAFLSGFKNPCWRDGPHGSLKCVPYAILAGVIKSGTTDLYFRMSLHPLIVKGISKENHYVNTLAFQYPACSKTKHKNVSGYCHVRHYAERFYSTAAGDILNNRLNNVPKGVLQNTVKKLAAPGFQGEWRRIHQDAIKAIRHPSIIVDGTPSTLWQFHKWQLIEENQGCEEPDYTHIDLQLKFNPNFKMIAILRNPVERMFSGYVFFQREEREETKTIEGFHEMAVTYIKAFEKCRIQYSLWRCILEAEVNRSYWGFPTLRVHVGLYHAFISQWLKRISRDRMLILHTESYNANIAEGLRQVFQFLELPVLSTRAREVISQSVNINNNSRSKKHIGHMLRKTRKILNEFYAPHNQKLAELLGDDRFLWKDV